MSLAVRSVPEAPLVPVPVRVMVCDDSLAIRGAIVRMLETDPAIRVVARAVNGKAAVEELARTPVDVLVLDIEMPVMDGLAALPSLLRADPQLRVIMASTLTTRGADIAMRALRLLPVVASVSGALHARNSGVVISSSAICIARSQNSTFS